MRQSKLLTAVIAMMLIGIVISAFTLWYVIDNRGVLTADFQKKIQEELKRYKFPEEEKQALSLNEAQVYIQVAKYCESHGNCRGRDGVPGRSIQGPVGPIGASGAQGLSGINGASVQGVPGVRGKDGEIGPQGPSGQDGRDIERRCNTNVSRMEWRLVGDENWKIEYSLAPGQTCGEE